MNNLIDEFLPRDAKSLKDNLFLAYSHGLHRDIIRLIILVLCPTEKREFNNVIDWLDAYLDSPSQFRKNPLIFADSFGTRSVTTAGLMALVAGDAIIPLIDQATNFYESVHLDIPDEFVLQDRCKSNELICMLRYPDFCRQDSVMVSQIYCSGDLFLGLVVPNPTKIKRAFVNFPYCDVQAYFDLERPILLTKQGFMFVIPELKVIPLIALYCERLELIVDCEDEVAKGIRMVYVLLNAGTARTGIIETYHDHIVGGNVLRFGAGRVGVVKL